ncbi:MAG: MBOAT family O-acyltransferase [Alphaproteobacteria bacterium]
MPGRYRTWWLIGASFVFYGWSGLEHALVLAASLLWVFALTASPGMIGHKGRLAAAIIAPLGALFFYKYLSFALGSFRSFFNTPVTANFSLFDDVLLPAGKSFFTFQLLAFAIDRYRGKIETQPPFAEIALYISFFPQLVAGPILRYDDVKEALRRLGSFFPTMRDIGEAAGYIIFGLAGKILVADAISNTMVPMVASPGELSAAAAAYVIIGYSFQIYFDFYAYSLIAIGLGRLFGFHFPANFLRPYDALNPRDFWRRWHVSLSFWIRDYLYFPLGGNRHYLRNIIIIFAVCGLWHGAGWNFVVWGLYHGLLVGGYHFVSGPWDRLPKPLQWGLNITLVSLGWSLFLYDFSGAWSLLTSLGGEGGNIMPQAWNWLILIFAAVVCFALNVERTIKYLVEAESSALSRITFGAGLAGLLILAVSFIDRSNTFIYFRF